MAKKTAKSRPCSLTQIRDWLEQGYQFEADDPSAACEVWWKAWCGLLSRLQPKTDTMLAADQLCPTRYSIFNWSQELQDCFWNAGLRDPKWFLIGEQFCQEWLNQFKGEPPQMRASFLGSLADFSFKLGKVSQAQQILEQLLVDYPNDPFSYIALADAYSHLFADRQHHLPFQPAKAEQLLRQGLARLPKQEDQKFLKDRLELLKEAIPVSQKPPLHPTN
jgi:hypothetical protein